MTRKDRVIQLLKEGLSYHTISTRLYIPVNQVSQIAYDNRLGTFADKPRESQESLTRD